MQEKWLSANFDKGFGAGSKPFPMPSGQNDNPDVLEILSRM